MFFGTFKAEGSYPVSSFSMSGYPVSRHTNMFKTFKSLADETMYTRYT